MVVERATPVVSVIIPCFNGGEWIREALRSVADQDLKGVEVVVVDDGSTDDSAGIVQREFGYVTLERTSNLGASHARNLGTQKARGSFIQYLDADDMLAPSKLRAQISALEATGADVAYGGWEEFQDQTGTNRLP